ncbi:molybdopterin-dependent oxidoreductase [Arcobacter sp. CECT 8985]|uniref:molybdopterin-containing oxidoreductase family protein n=1 Tax=Arcobacter sp. CECT 8985 TaxID=1935424 RepID=UPI0013E97DE2|nr:molybdopterin-dependent oxidoreductase [Arcobacter sp. CECT 8985]
MNRRDFIKNGALSLAALKLGEVISLSPNKLEAKEIKTFQDFNTLAKNIKGIQRVPSVCLNCSTICGMTVLVKNGEILGVEGNPLDPNSEGKLCAKAHGGVNAVDYPERIVYPLKRVGKRGDGLWKRITMEEAYEIMSSKIKKCIDDKKPEGIVFHGGRNKMGDITGRFMDAVGSPVILNHRALCSSNKRAANYTTIGDTSWETIDARECKYFLNFGSNFLENHQGGFALMKRFIEAKQNGAKLITFDTRLSNTAGKSDEWYAPYPSSEGAIALAMANVIMENKLYNEKFINEWCNVSVDEFKDFIKPYTVEFAQEQSGIDAKEIKRIAIEFAKAAPNCSAFTNRGSQAHYNGLHNDRAVVILNALVGSIGQKGGYAYGGSKSKKDFPMPKPIPPKPSFTTDLEDPKLYPFANKWQKMRVSELCYDKIKSKKHNIQVYMSYTISSPQTWPEGPQTAVEVLKDEKLIPFHVCSDVVYSEMAHYSDLILPDATYFERYTIEGRNAYELIPYFVLRQPAVNPPYDCENFADTLIKVAKRLGKPVAKYFTFDSYEEFIKLRFKNLPKKEGLSGFEYMKKYGAWVEDKPKNYEPFNKLLTKKDLENSYIKDNIIYKTKKGKKKAIGIVKDGLKVKGFKTPSRKFEIVSNDIIKYSKKLGLNETGFPHFKMPKSLKEKKDDELILTTFKWNVHTQARTAPQKYLTEIVHDNPMWINTKTAKKYNIKNGDMVKITTYRPKEGYKSKEKNSVVGTMDVKAFVTEGIHPEVLAISNSLGMNYAGRVPKARNGKKENLKGYSDYKDLDLNGHIWWDKRLGGSGNGFNPNNVIPVNPAPLAGMQAWNDTICKIEKI